MVPPHRLVGNFCMGLFNLIMMTADENDDARGGGLLSRALSARETLLLVVFLVLPRGNFQHLSSSPFLQMILQTS